MSTYGPNEDARMDRNLHRLAEHFQFPADAGTGGTAPGQVPAETGDGASLRKGVRFMRKHRMLSIFGAGSAMAAVIAMGVILGISTRHGRVQASEIFDSLKGVIGNAFRLTFEKIGEDGFTVDGHVVMVFEQPTNLLQNQSDPKATHVSFRVVADETAEEVAGLDASGEVALADGNKWAYVKVAQVPLGMASEEPMVAAIMNMASDGLLIKLDTLLEELDNSDGAGAEGGDDSAEGSAESGEAGAHLTLAPSIWVKTEASDQSQAPAEGAPGDEPGKKLTTSLNFSFKSAEPAAPAAEQNGTATFDLQLEDEQLNEIIGRVIKGEATSQDMADLVAKIEQSASDVHVDDLGDGLYRLVATGFSTDEADADEFLAGASFEVLYQQGAGLKSASLTNIGPQAGSVRFELADVTLEDPMFDSNRVLEDGKAKTFDPGLLLKLLGGGSE